METNRRMPAPAPTLYSLLVLTLLVATALFLLRRFGIDAPAIWAAVRTAEPSLYMLAALSFYASLVIRAWRWQLIMQATVPVEEEGRPPSVAACTGYVLIGRFADSVSVARVGNLYRAYLASQWRGNSFSRILGTTVAESVLDMAVVFGAAVGVGLLLSAQNAPVPTRETAGAASAGAVLLALGLLLMRRYGLALARLLPGWGAAAYARFHQGALGALGQRQMPALVTLTALGWLCAVARWYLVAGALGATVSFPLVLFVSLANAVIAAIPITPGGLGVVEPGVTALFALQMPMNQALALTLSERFISYVSVVLLGGTAFLSLGVGIPHNRLGIVRRFLGSPRRS